jgi:hypothetical protein
MKAIVLSAKSPIHRSSLRRVFHFIPLVLVCFGLASMAQAVGPDTDGAIPGSNNGEGIGVLVSRTSGVWNTGTGFEALNHLTAGNQNTATGLRALNSDINGGFNTATGVFSLFSNTSGFFNSATGAYSLANNTIGSDNTANGYGALWANTADSNTATGFAALFHDIAGPFNTAVGFEALMNATANANAAVGDLALQNVSTGFFNTAIGAAAGIQQTTGHNNIYIGQGSFGVAGESNTCYIQGIAGASIPTATASVVFVDTATGKLATMLVDANGNRVTAPQGQPEAVPQRSDVSEDGHQAMLNLKVEKLQATVAQQHKQIETLTAQLKEQAAQIQKASAQQEVSKPAPQVVVNKP